MLFGVIKMSTSLTRERGTKDEGQDAFRDEGECLIRDLALYVVGWLYAYRNICTSPNDPKSISMTAIRANTHGGGLPFPSVVALTARISGVRRNVHAIICGTHPKPCTVRISPRLRVHLSPTHEGAGDCLGEPSEDLGERDERAYHQDLVDRDQAGERA